VVQEQRFGMWRPVASLPLPRTFSTVPAKQLMLMSQPMQAARPAITLMPPDAPLYDLRQAAEISDQHCAWLGPACSVCLKIWAHGGACVCVGGGGGDSPCNSGRHSIIS